MGAPCRHATGAPASGFSLAGSHGETQQRDGYKLFGWRLHSSSSQMNKDRNRFDLVVLVADLAHGFPCRAESVRRPPLWLSVAVIVVRLGLPSDGEALPVAMPTPADQRLERQGVPLARFMALSRISVATVNKVIQPWRSYQTLDQEAVIQRIGCPKPLRRKKSCSIAIAAGRGGGKPSCRILRPERVS